TLVFGCRAQSPLLFYRVDFSDDDRKALLRGELILSFDSTFNYYEKADIAILSVTSGRWRKSNEFIFLYPTPHTDEEVFKMEIVEVQKSLQDSLPRNKKHIIIYDQINGGMFPGITVKLGSKDEVFLNRPIEVPPTVREGRFSLMEYSADFDLHDNDNCNLFVFFVSLRGK